jgi:hypothetical protein
VPEDAVPVREAVKIIFPRGPMVYTKAFTHTEFIFPLPSPGPVFVLDYSCLQTEAADPDIFNVRVKLILKMKGEKSCLCSLCR